MLCRTSRLFFSLQQAFDERGIPAEIVGLAGLLRAARGRRGARVRARGERSARERGARAGSCSARGTASGSRTSRASPRWAKAKNYALRRETERGEARRRRSCSPRRSSTSTRSRGSPTRPGRGSRSSARELRGLAGGGAPARRRVPGRGHPPDRHRRRARRRTSIGRCASQRERNLAAFLDQVHAFAAARGRADAPRVPRLRRRGERSSTSRSGRRSSRPTRTR